MKKKWQEVSKRDFAIKVAFKENDVRFTLYDRNDKKLFEAKRNYPCTDDVFNSGVNECSDYADEQCGNNGEFTYVYNPYWGQCKDVMVG